MRCISTINSQIAKQKKRRQRMKKKQFQFQFKSRHRGRNVWLKWCTRLQSNRTRNSIYTMQQSTYEWTNAKLGDVQCVNHGWIWIPGKCAKWLFYFFRWRCCCRCRWWTADSLENVVREWTKDEMGKHRNDVTAFRVLRINRADMCWLCIVWQKEKPKWTNSFLRVCVCCLLKNRIDIGVSRHVDLF